MKRIMALGMALILSMGSACAAVSVRMDDAAALLSEDGAEIVPAGAYDDIVDLGGGLFAAQTGGRYALMGADGELKTAAEYGDLRLTGDFLIAESSGGWGMLDLDGRELSAFGYAQLEPTGEGGCWAALGSQDNLEPGEFCTLDAQGRERTTEMEIRQMGDPGAGGLLPILLPGYESWGYCDAQGYLQIEPRFEYAGPFVAGCAAVVAEGRYGAVDADGNYVVAPEYDFLEVSPSGFILAARAQEGAWVFGADGALRAEYAGEDVFAALVGGGYAVADPAAVELYGADGALLAEFGPDAAVYEGMDGQLIASEGMWGEACVGILGTQPRYQNLYLLGRAQGAPVYASMSARVARYMNDLLGEIQLSVDMDTARYGLVGAAGEELLPCRYELIEALCDDRFLVYAQGRWQMIDAAGKVYWSRAATRTEAPNS